MSALQVPHTCYRWAPVCHWDWMPIPCWGEACSSGYACFCLLWWSPEHSAGGGQGHLPSLLRPQFRCTPIPHGSRYFLMWCSELTPVKSAGTWQSQNYLKVHHNGSGFQSPSTSNCWPFCNLNCHTHEGKSCWGYLDIQWSAALWSSDSSAYWFLSVIQCRRDGILAAVKEPTAAQFFLFQSGGISSYSGCYLTILSEAKCYKKELTTRSSYNVKLPQSCPS